MSKNTTANYKKSYEGDYLKSYKNASEEYRQRKIRRKEYATASKKIGTTSYNRGGEKGRITAEQTGSVNAAGPSQAQRRNREILRELQVPKLPTIKGEGNYSEDTALPSPQIGEKREKYQTKIQRKASSKKKHKDDLSHIDRNSNKSPIEVLPNGEYKDVYSNEIVDIEGARKRLQYMGYTERPEMSSNIMMVLAVGGMLVPLIGPLILFSVGKQLQSKTLTTYQRNLRGARPLFFSLRASESTISKNSKKGKYFIWGAVIVGFYQFYLFF